MVIFLEEPLGLDCDVLYDEFKPVNLDEELLNLFDITHVKGLDNSYFRVDDELFL